MRLIRETIAAAICLGALLALPASGPAQTAGAASCAAPDELLAEGRLSRAEKQYRSVLAADPSAGCATTGLNRITAAERAEKRFCEQGEKLAEAGKDEAAEVRYTRALDENVGSKCAKAGLAEGSGSFWQSVADADEDLAHLPSLLGNALLILAGSVAIVGIVWTLVRRRRRSLVIRPFGDDAVKPPLGAGMAGLVEQQLKALSHAKRRAAGDDLDPDFLATDVELLAEDRKLADAVGRVSEVSQLSLALAIFDLADRILPARRHLVAAELLPPGARGEGVSLAVYRHNSLWARGSLWHEEVKEWLPGATEDAEGRETPTAASKDEKGEQVQDPGPYYDLAVPAAWWVQYEVARSTDSSVSLITADARSFALLGAGIALQREGEDTAAVEAYEEALKVDPDNVVAKVNLAGLRARLLGRYRNSVVLLEEALATLESRYEEVSGA